MIFSKVLSADDHNDFLVKCCQRTTIMIFSKVLSADDHNDFEYSVVSGRPYDFDEVLSADDHDNFK